MCCDRTGGLSACSNAKTMRRQRQGLRQAGYDTEKGPAITKNIPPLPAAYHSKKEFSSWSTESLQPVRPAIKVITDISIGKSLPKSPGKPTTPKWKLKRVLVPRLSRLPPFPMPGRARSRLSFSRSSRSSSRQATKIDIAPPVPVLPSPSLPPTPLLSIQVSTPAGVSSTFPFFLFGFLHTISRHCLALASTYHTHHPNISLPRFRCPVISGFPTVHSFACVSITINVFVTS
ncbi:uncharacterized protein BT62DRAFT_928304 [Guyanagaster necrorhizus]|uniref:Uncharacterized protein n=1 Tax=Guyanagaster necrorhizus TaxID=856835 RepID=A0A9P8AVR0_9AGAR|nr:uncharacterized protein BT62DRAFT_928304 [Guyanagaster necrorhizus MCA 3950]KAG7449585.1 hypothetical protein BT62DRAFT_928304 [Guyanagaster necrorhizus MCA 3950]